MPDSVGPYLEKMICLRHIFWITALKLSFLHNRGTQTGRMMSEQDIRLCDGRGRLILIPCISAPMAITPLGTC